jgi:prepilin-type processing-associated H-X9-DG protein
MYANRDYRFFRCPSATPTWFATAITSPAEVARPAVAVMYGMNGFSPGLWGQPIGAIPSPGLKILAIDASWYRADDSDTGARFRHGDMHPNGRANIVFVDGHVKSMRKAELTNGEHWNIFNPVPAT